MAHFGELDCRSEQFAPGRLAKLLMGEPKPGHGSGDTYGGGAFGTLRDHFIKFPLGQRLGCGFAKIDGQCGAVCGAYEEKSPAAKVASAWVGDNKYEGGRDSCIDRVAACFQDGDARPGGSFFHRAD